MGHVLSSDTIYAVAYLTDLGRKYLFDPITNNRFTSDGLGGTIDAFKIVYFSMSDPDYNYDISSSYPFQTGDISNVSGKNDDCIKGTIVKEEDNLISANGQIDGIGGLTPSGPIVIDSPIILGTDAAEDISTIDLTTIPTSTE